MVTELLGDQRGVAVIALGGYARRELCPRSDIDLLLLHDGWPRAGLEGLVERLCYPLWDARLVVGHAVRTPAQAVADAGGRVDSATALLDRRLVAGETGLADALTALVQRWSRRHGRSLVERLAATDTARHERAGAHPGMLEPDLKNGAGGLRDIHSLRWAAGWIVGEPTLDTLVAAGYLGADERRRLAAANDTLLRARCALHRLQPAAGGQLDVLRLEHQDDVAASPGAVAGGGDADELLRQVGLAARAVWYIHSRTWSVLLRDARRGRLRRRQGGVDLGNGVSLREGTVDVDTTGDLRTDPALGLRAVAAAATHGAHLSRRAATYLSREISQCGDLAWTADAREALLQTLHAGPGAVQALFDADHIGLLSAHLPQWRHIRGRPQRNALHRFDLDTHAAHAVAALGDVRGEDAYREAWSALDDTDTVVLATWLHDIGKAWPGDHSEVGAGVAAEIMSHMGFASSTAKAVSHLVREHLLLAQTATRRDLDDPREIALVAQRTGTPAVLDALYLLTVADGRATGPAAWSPWKDNLVTTLYRRARALLTGHEPGPELDTAAAAVTFGATDHQLELLRRHAPPAYFTVAEPAQVAAHARLLETGVGTVEIRPGEIDDTTVVSIVAQDRRGLLADCAGVLRAHGAQVLQARALTGPNGTALDWLTVQGQLDTDVVVRDLVQAAAGRLPVAQLAGPPRVRGTRDTATVVTPRDVPVRVTVRNSRTLEVQAPDHPGVLYRLCAAVAGAGLDLATVRVSTTGGAILDVFELARPASHGELMALSGALRAAARPENDVL